MAKKAIEKTGKSINFCKMELTDIEGKNPQIVAISKDFAKIMHKHGSGLIGSNLAQKIYNSDGDIPIDPEEENEIIFIAERFCTAQCMIAIKNQLQTE